MRLSAFSLSRGWPICASARLAVRLSKHGHDRTRIGIGHLVGCGPLYILVCACSLYSMDPGSMLLQYGNTGPGIPYKVASAHKCGGPPYQTSNIIVA